MDQLSLFLLYSKKKKNYPFITGEWLGRVYPYTLFFFFFF